MKILLVQDHLRSGGTERQTLLLARAFAGAGHVAGLITFRPGGALAAGGCAPVIHRSLQPFDIGLDWFAPGLVDGVRREQPDVVLCMGRMANCQAGRLQRNLPGRIVLATMRTGKSLPWLFRRSLREVGHIVANSHAAKNRLIAEHGLPAEKITVIHNPLVFDPSAAAAPPPPARRTPRPVALLNVAMFRPEKNQRELIELCAGLPPGLDWRLILAGDGPARAACEQLAGRLGLAARVRFPGFVADPTPFYREADLAVLTSRSDSLSNFLCEAQAHGLPAVAYDIAGVGECFQPGRSGFLIPNRDRAGFLARLTELIRDGAERERFATAARAYAGETFDFTRQVQRHLDLFARLLAPGSAGSAARTTR
jgi:glycosyltransferase involved in cell wall biosynthesis